MFQFDQAGGHAGGIIYDGEKMIKKTKPSEIENYSKIFDDSEETSLTKLRPFVPKYYGADLTASSGGKIDMTIENLLHGLENGSYIDIKLGSSTLTMNSSLRKKFTRDFVD